MGTALNMEFREVIIKNLTCEQRLKEDETANHMDN
jgi:hypothetical protein